MPIPASSVIRITQRTVLQKQVAQSRSPAEKQYYLQQLQKMEKQIPTPPTVREEVVTTVEPEPVVTPPVPTERYAEITTKSRLTAEQVNKTLKAIKMMEKVIAKTPNKQIASLLRKQIKIMQKLISGYTTVAQDTVGPLEHGYTYEKPATIEKAIGTQVENLKNLSSYIKEIQTADVDYFMLDGVKITKQNMLGKLSKNVMLLGNSIKELHKLRSQRVIIDKKTGKKTYWKVDIYQMSGVVQLRPNWNRIPDADKFFYPGAKEYFNTLPYSEKERILTKKSIDTNVNFYVSGEFAISNSGIPYFKKRVEAKLKQGLTQRQAIIEVMLDNQIEPSKSAERALDTMSDIEKNISAFRRTAQEFTVGTLIGIPVIAEMALEEGVGRLHSVLEGKGFEKKEYLPIREVVAPYIFKKAVTPYYGPNVGIQLGTGIESLGREITGVKAPEGFAEQVKEQERLREKYPSMQLASIGGAVFGTSIGTSALTKATQLGGLAKGKVLTYAMEKSPLFTKAYSTYQMYKPTAYISRQIKKGFHKYVPPKEIFAKTVMQKKGSMEMFKGDIHQYFKHMEKFRQPDGTVPLLHGAHARLATGALRQRVTAIIVKDGKVLMVSHTTKGTKTYMLPGGAKNAYELSRRALAREIAEEVGLKVKTSKHLFDIPDYPSGNLYKVYKVTVTGTAKKLQEITGLKWVSIGKISGKTAWHVKPIIKKYITKDYTSPAIIGKTRFGYPKKFIVGAGERQYSHPGMYFTLKGELGEWAFGLRKPLKTVYGYGRRKLAKPSILETRGKIFTRLPKKVRFDVKAASDYLKHVHQKEIKFYATAKLEKGLHGAGIAESEWLAPPGTGMLKKPLGYAKTTLKEQWAYQKAPIREKWYNWWAKRTGYQEFTIHPTYGKILPIRKYTVFKPELTTPAGKAAQIRMLGGKPTTKIPGIKTVVSPKEMAKMTQMSSAYRELMSGYQYKSYYSPSYASYVTARSYGSLFRPSKPSYPYYKPPYYSTSYSAYKPSYYSKPSYPEPSEPSYPSYPYEPSPSYSTYPSYTSYYYPYPSATPASAPTVPLIPIILPEETLTKRPVKSYHAYSNGRRLTKKPLSRKQALGVGASHTDKTVSTKFHLKQSFDPAGSQPRHAKTWSKIQHKFTTTDKHAYKEKTKYQKDYDIERQRFVPLKAPAPLFKAKSTKKHTSTLKKVFDPFKPVKINIGGIK